MCAAGKGQATAKLCPASGDLGHSKAGVPEASCHSWSQRYPEGRAEAPAEPSPGLDLSNLQPSALAGRRTSTRTLGLRTRALRLGQQGGEDHWMCSSGEPRGDLETGRALRERGVLGDLGHGAGVGQREHWGFLGAKATVGFEQRPAWVTPVGPLAVSEQRGASREQEEQQEGTAPGLVSCGGPVCLEGRAPGLLAGDLQSRSGWLCPGPGSGWSWP